MPIRNPGRLGCENCRTRRIKCNELRPRCSQCARAGLTCSGYRNPVDLIFQDQTACITQKYHTAESKVIHQARHSQSSRPSSPTGIIPRLPVDEIAWWVYFENFNIMRPSGAPIHRPYPSQSSPVFPAVASVGLAALAVVHSDPHLMQLARQKYSSALRILVCAINDPDELRQTRTAITSFNLSMFEMIVYDNFHPPSHGWLRHMHGTTALLRSLELTEGTPTVEIRALLQIAYTADCGNMKSRELILPLTDLFTILCKLVNLHRATCFTNDTAQNHQFINTALNMYQDLESWLTSVPVWWVDPIRTGQAPRIDDECWIMRVWVYYRLCQILAHKAILDNMDILYSSGDSSQQRQYEESLAVISQASQELYIGVPALLGASHIANQSTPGLTSNVFFLITVLQTMCSLTPKEKVVENWSQSARAYGKDFEVIQNLILSRLN
ncbi:hypothetical protein Asppvi_007068 [Aspergillus pseudoviridinutans]|uniref:Zn(2)-C6 fungal-type domain-containing protein n=1 Tax=Aspergillus pseudoviridinutans TaxID=1517512 RepID=A0A9P3EU36_9EURO|nr:uncharacterized protein Asppvi_007068 [Aspergillus pseudoviridinutans]GIJ88151.1 hypothetical protein Asppvi_007068 [Aspergillus pseudoviridinutans]